MKIVKRELKSKEYHSMRCEQAREHPLLWLSGILFTERESRDSLCLPVIVDLFFDCLFESSYVILGSLRDESFGCWDPEINL